MRSRELRKDARSTGLPEQSIKVLEMLLEQPGKVVLRDDIRMRLWPCDTVVEFDHSINTAIRKLRLALGDSADSPRYIETLARRGYRWIGSLESVERPQCDVTAPDLPTQPDESPLFEREPTGQRIASPPLLDQVVKPTVEAPPSRSILTTTRRRVVIASIAVLALASAYFVADRQWISNRIEPAQLAALTTPGLAAFTPPPRSIAVLPFVNMSGDKEQEYFSDGLTEELLNSLSRIDELQVAARTSSFYFKGKDADLPTIAHKLNVGSVLEGSVRRSGKRIRITAQLSNAVTGFHLWSQTYDRDLSDVLQLQAEIANSVAGTLKVTLLSDVTEKVELGGTRSPAAFDAYLRGRKAHARGDAKAYPDAVAAYTEAIRVDPNYALAFAGRSIAYSNYAGEVVPGSAIREFYGKALADAHRALAIAPELAEGYLALAVFFDNSLDFPQAGGAYERARALGPGNTEVLRLSGQFAVYMGHTELGLTGLRRAAVLDPLNPHSHEAISEALYYARRYQEAVVAATDAISLDSDYERAYGYRGLGHYGRGDFERARTSCVAKPDYWISQWCLTLTYAKRGPRAVAEATLAKFKADNGDASAYQYATVYAQRGNTPEALEWLDTAVRVRDPGLEYLKTDPLMDPLRKEPRFRAIERELKFPD